MLDAVYSLIHESPKVAAWAFGVINALWLAFVYFNNKRHEREMKRVQHNLDLDLERRKTVFALKVSSYERYVRLLDDFGKKYQTQLLDRMMPMFSQYLSETLAASETRSAERGKNAISSFFHSVMSLMNEATQEYLQLRAESKTLKLTASAPLLTALEQLEGGVTESMDTSQEFMRKFPDLFISNDQAEIQRYQSCLADQGASIHRMSRELEQQMRADLAAI